MSFRKLFFLLCVAAALSAKPDPNWKKLSSGEETVKLNAARKLLTQELSREELEKVFDAIWPLLESMDEDIQKQALEILARVQPIPQKYNDRIKTELADEFSEKKEALLKLIQKMKPENAAQYLDETRRLLEDEELRLEAVGALANMGEPAARLLPNFVLSENSGIKRAALLLFEKLSATGALQNLSKEETNRLINAFDSCLKAATNPIDVREACAQNMVKTRPKSFQVLRKLSRSLLKGDVAGRVAAAKGIHLIGASAYPALKTLIRALNDKNPEVRLYVVLTLKEIGKKARKALPDLRDLLQDEDPKVKAAAAAAIYEIEK